MKPYKPSNKAPILGIFLLMLISSFGGTLLGLLAYAISKVIYVFILFPAGLGFIGGLCLYAGIHRGKIRNPVVGIIFGIAISFIIYGTYRYAEYYAFRADGQDFIIQEIEQGYGTSDPEVADLIVDEILFEETGSSGFWGYLILAANKGTSVGRLFRGESFHFGPTLTWIYWLIELLIIIGVSVSATQDGTKAAFCETCQNWYKPKKYLGGVRAEREKLLLQAIMEENFSEVGKLIQEEAPAPSIDIRVQDCDCESNDSVLSVEHVSISKKNKLQYKNVLHGLISPAHRSTLSEYEKQNGLDSLNVDDGEQYTSEVQADETNFDRKQTSSEPSPEKDYTKTRIVLIVLILAIVLPVCFSFLYYSWLSN